MLGMWGRIGAWGPALVRDSVLGDFDGNLQKIRCKRQKTSPTVAFWQGRAPYISAKAVPSDPVRANHPTHKSPFLHEKGAHTTLTL